MQDKKLLQIGEVAKIFHVSMGTLRHYEQEGLLEPEYVDEKTGYRYYGVRQLEVLNTIRYAEHIYYDRKREWNKIVDRAMATDYSWKVSAGKYQEMYDWLIG